MNSLQYRSFKFPLWHVHELKRKISPEMDFVEKLMPGPFGKLKVVSMVREPISRNVSAFFQFIDDYVPEYEKSSVEGLVDVFFREYPHHMPLTWFDEEMSPVFGIDVFEKKFSKDKGYQILGNDKVDLLLIKMEKLNECANEAFGEFLGINNFQIVSSNTGDRKRYKSIYNKFKMSINFPQTYIDKMYDSNYVQHFYKKEEITSFRRKW